MSVRRTGPRRMLLAAGAIVVMGAIFVLVRHLTEDERTRREVMAAAAPSVGRLESIAMSGRATALGHAFATDAGSMVSTCAGVAPNTQLVVRLGERTAAAQVARIHAARGVCRLAVVDVGSWPLRIRGDVPRAGERVYAALLASGGELMLAPTEVVGVFQAEGGQALELAMPVEASHDGAPVLDRRGRVVGMLAARHPFGPNKNVALPAAWIAQ